LCHDFREIVISRRDGTGNGSTNTCDELDIDLSTSGPPPSCWALRVVCFDIGRQRSVKRKELRKYARSRSRGDQVSVGLSRRQLRRHRVMRDF